MRVNFSFKHFSRSQFAASTGIGLFIVGIFLLASSFTKPSNRDALAKKTNLIVRQLGHRLLLQAGDSTSRVLPVSEIREGTFLLQFERNFVFSHDSLMSLSRALLPKSEFPAGYTVTVHECENTSIVYGFQVNKSTPDILACQGRREPAGCYTIEILFPDLYETSFDYPVAGLVGSGLLLFSVSLLIGRFSKNPTATTLQHQHQSITKESVLELAALGKFLFDVKHQRLLLGDEVISLTDKECRVLELLSNNFGELIPRETLMEKVWISEGVITGRSLDMFVSKLRKKLSSDPDLRITNVHGKGYKLEIP
ncbi:MAG TPA: winged helix-turn-helix domain-containing protein [Chryseosolibacter sp.]|nr:winged helix-turn-helix domain-containing protein [Chryseosolibacter sp.]